MRILRGDFAAHAFQVAKRIQQAAMGRRIEQAAIIGLAMHFQQQSAKILEQPHADRLVIDEGARFSIGGKTAAQHDLALMRHRLLLEQRAGAMIGTGIEHCGGGALRRAGPHRRAAAAAHGKAQRVQQNGFARPGLAGQDIKARREFQRGLLDQHDVADRQCGEHADADSKEPGGKLG